ncbi:hypothetical protein BDY19DRAFT_996211 [Irpex rosettiformis]|uniref:Uncharacterized protein n=1 Tax=Irpex rosettiformis TaxID=378272 RepID=A0ACB8TVM2_9APHY|nr:hypothetical protein BDY19DRAFT_996211 [Irpex rosettiformis]
MPVRCNVSASAVAHDTSSEVKQAVTAPIIRCNVERDHQALVDYIGSSIPEAPVQWFKDNILPPLPACIRQGLPAILRSLKANGHINKNGRWAVFPVDPSQSSRIEDVVYGPFASVAAAIGEAAANKLPSYPQRVIFKCNPNLVPMSSFRNNRSRPDGYGVYTAHDSYQPQADDSAIHWELVVAPGEKKKKESDSDFNDNVRKILWSFSHIMRDDHRRRFVIGYTIENTNMRLWFCSRKDIIVTKPFNFIQDHATLAHFLLSQMYAKRHELGYDTTIRPPSDVQLRVRNQWDVKVHYDEEEGAGCKRKRTRSQTCKQEITFRTTGLISSIGAKGVRGRGTRVWQGQTLVNGQMQPDSDEMVMKEYWVDSDRMREAEIWRRILEDAVTEEDRELLKRHLLTPLYSGDVVVDGKLDTTDRLRNHATISADDGFKMAPLTRDSRQTNPNYSAIEASQGFGAIPPWLVSPAIPRIVVLDDKSHHRIIFKEKGVTIEHLTTVSLVLHAAMQALNALRTMHKSGWVHRDVSSGNILIVDGVVKISDLEYAKNMNDGSPHSERPGTALFMSIEAGFHEYKFGGGGGVEASDVSVTPLSTFEKLLKGNLYSEDGIEDTTRSWVPAKPSFPTKSPVFRYNPLHDIESIWWLLVYLLLYRPPVIKGDTETRISNQSSFYGRFFTPGHSRRDAFMQVGVFTSHKGHLHPELQPVADTLERIRKLLYNCYVKAEQGDISKINHTVASGVTERLIVELGVIREEYAKEDVKLCPIRVPRRRMDPEPLAAAAVAGASASLDCRRLMGAKWRAPHDEGNEEESLRKCPDRTPVEDETNEKGCTPVEGY